MEELINILKNKNKTISTMESCTGGMFASEITNIEGASDVFKLGLVTYSNEFKEYFGVSKENIKKYSVYSNEISNEMAFNVCKISKSDFAVGITGMLGIVDPNNKCDDINDDINKVYISIYSKEIDSFLKFKIEAKGANRIEKKKYIIEFIKEKLFEILEK